jgi:hypothetical protein
VLHDTGLGETKGCLRRSKQGSDAEDEKGLGRDRKTREQVITWPQQEKAWQVWQPMENQLRGLYGVEGMDGLGTEVGRANA